MKFKAITTLKRADTEGRISAYTLDQYIRADLSQQLADALQPNLTIDRRDVADTTFHTHVNFSTEITVFAPQQWQQLKTTLFETAQSLSPEHQHVIHQLIAMIERT